MNLLSYRNAHSFPHPSSLCVFAEYVTCNTPIDYAALGQPVDGMPPALHMPSSPPLHRLEGSSVQSTVPLSRPCYADIDPERPTTQHTHN